MTRHNSSKVRVSTGNSQYTVGRRRVCKRFFNCVTKSGSISENALVRRDKCAKTVSLVAYLSAYRPGVSAMAKLHKQGGCLYIHFQRQLVARQERRVLHGKLLLKKLFVAGKLLLYGKLCF